MSAPTRPQALTSACLVVGAACFVLLVSAIGWLTSWTSIETQEALQKVFTPKVLGDVGIGFDEAVRWTRWLLLVVVAVLISGVVFAAYTAMGHRSSRVMLTIIAAFASIMFLLTGGWVGILPAAFLAFIGMRLWSPEANRWMAVKNGKEPPARAVTPPVPPTYAEPNGSGVPPVQQPYAPTSAQLPPAPPNPRRTVALVVLVCSSVVAFGSATYLLMYAFARDALVQQQLESGFNWTNLTEVEIRDSLDALAVLCGVGLVVGTVAAVVSIVLMRRYRSR